MNLRLVLLLVTLRTAVSVSDIETPDDKFNPCGLFGFRCLDKQHAQICDEKYKDDESSVTPSPRIFICADGLICDEEKKEFCSPVEHSPKNCSCTKRENCPCCQRQKASHMRQDSRVRKKARNFFEDDESFTNAARLTTLDDDDDNEATTEKGEVDQWNGSPPIDCTSHGFYPDTSNKSLFFFCDLKKSGNGFILRHMRCGPNRYFEGNFRACVLKGSTRNIRRDKKNEKPKIIDSPKTSSFDCLKKKPGKYKDKSDCHIYHLCLPSSLYAPFEHLTVECPHSTAFHPKKKICSTKAQRFCNKDSEMNVYCEVEIRFRETRACDTYFLCYRDQVVEFACPPGFMFDESLQFCQPGCFVHCE